MSELEATYWARAVSCGEGVTCGCLHGDEVTAASCAARLEDELGVPEAVIRRKDGLGIDERRWDGEAGEYRWHVLDRVRAANARSESARLRREAI